MDTTESELPVPSSMSSPTSDSAHVGKHHFMYIESLELELVAVAVACCCCAAYLILLR
jgi:hypothetical protein